MHTATTTSSTPSDFAAFSPRPPPEPPPSEHDERAEHLRQSLDRAASHYLREGPPDGGLLYFGVDQQAVPTMLFYDPILESTERNLYCILRLEAKKGNPMPSYAQLRRFGNIGSDATIASSLKILRLTRWTARYKTLRDAAGRVQGNLYCVPDEPLPLALAMELDPDYMELAEECLQHEQKRVRQIARLVIDSLMRDLDSGVDLYAAPDPYVVRQEAAAALVQANSHSDDPHSEAQKPARYYGLYLHLRQDNRSLQNLKSASLQNLKSDRLQNLKRRSSSSYIDTTTTTTANAKFSDLRWPGPLGQLNGNHKRMLFQALRAVAVEERQLYLNELAGRMRAKSPPIRNPLAYLAKLVKNRWLTSYAFDEDPSRASGAEPKPDPRQQLREDIFGLRQILHRGRQAGQEESASNRQLQQQLEAKQRELRELETLTGNPLNQQPPLQSVPATQ